MSVFFSERKHSGFSFPGLLILIFLIVGIPSLTVYKATSPEKETVETEKYSLSSPVADEAGIFSADELNRLNAFLSDLDTRTGIQIAVLTVPDMNGEDIESFSLRHAEEWRLGQKGKDNGVLLTVAMKEHDIRIETGYGTEGVLTDAICSRIIRNIIVPMFQEEKYAEGITRGIESIAAVMTGDSSMVNEPDNDAQEVTAEKKETVPHSATFIAAMFFIVIFILLFSGRGGRNLWILPFFLNGGHYSGKRNNDSFHGGGGTFGGGGASGKW